MGCLRCPPRRHPCSPVRLLGDAWWLGHSHSLGDPTTLAVLPPAGPCSFLSQSRHPTSRANAGSLSFFILTLPDMKTADLGMLGNKWGVFSLLMILSKCSYSFLATVGCSEQGWISRKDEAGVFHSWGDDWLTYSDR